MHSLYYFNPLLLFSISVIIKYNNGIYNARKIFLVESYVRNRSYKTTRKEFERKCGAETTA
jgi:uncharacterized membrane protein